jgi:HAD superfamily hydrolase (TIGR01509 family)
MAAPTMSDRMPAAVIFDLDGVLVDSETVWDEARQQVVTCHGGQWRPEATREMMGMSSTEWATYLRDELGVRLDPDAISDEVVRLVQEQYADRLPLLPGAVETVRNIATHWRLGLASSFPRLVIDLVLEGSALGPMFAVTVSSEEVARGKPAPDVYLEAARRLGVAPEQCVAIEDSTNGIRAGLAAGMAVIAVPTTLFPPDDAVLDQASVVVGGLGDVTVDLIRTVADA